MATGDKLVSLDGLKAVYDKVDGDVGVLKSAIDYGTFTERTDNLFNPLFGMKYDYATAKIDGDTIKVTATADRTYCSARLFVDVRDISKVTVSYKSYSGTGSGRIRIGYSTDGQTHGGWIGFVDSNPKTFDVSARDYISVYLYAVYTENKGIGNYVIYDSLMINAGDTALDYAPQLIAVDRTARNNIDDLQLEIDQNTCVEYLSEKAIASGTATMPRSIMSLGDISSAGLPIYNVNYRAITAPILKLPFDALVTCPSAYYLRVCYYTDGEYTNKQEWYRSIEIPAGQEFRLLIRNVPEDTTVIGDVDTFAAAITVTNQSYTPGTGTQIYIGEQIKLETDFSRQNRCSITEWKDFVNATGLRLYDNQSIAAFGGYMFIFVDAGGGIVLDMATKEIISQFTTNYSSNDHQNSAQFSDIYYADGDEFPLLFVSRCRGNAPEFGDENLDTCLVYRVTKSGTQFTFTLVNTILWDHTTYGLDWSVDSGARMLYTCSLQNGRYTVTENNPLVFVAFDMPTKTQILSGDTITLTDNDVRIRFETDHANMQGSAAANGVLYVAVVDETQSVVRQHVWAFDAVRQRVTAKVKLLNNLECEGVTIADGIMYVSQRRNANSGDDNPLKIYAIEFA